MPVTRSQTRQALRRTGLIDHTSKPDAIERAHTSRAEDGLSEQDTPEQAQIGPRQAPSTLLAILYAHSQLQPD